MTQDNNRAPADKVKPTKPAKPRADFPLYAHASGRWAKKIRGQTHYFGPWSDPDAALAAYLDQKDALYAGRTPRRAEGIRLRDLLNAFLNFKQDSLDAGEIVQRTFDEYKATTDYLGAFFGQTSSVEAISPADFERLRAELAKSRGPTALGNEVQRIRTVFRYGYESDLLTSPMRFGTAFRRPSKKTMRKVRNQRGPRMFEADEIRRMLAVASPQLKAMILLAVNCGFGNADCGTLPRSVVNLDTGWIGYPRPKTGVQRRCPMWPETIAAIRTASAARPEPKDPAHTDLVFITKYGGCWFTGTTVNPLSAEIGKLLDALSLRRGGRNFYALRHTFETIAGESRDQIAVDAIMGHERPDMATVYRERISDERLKAVSDHVHAWLFAAD